MDPNSPQSNSAPVPQVTPAQATPISTPQASTAAPVQAASTPVAQNSAPVPAPTPAQAQTNSPQPPPKAPVACKCPVVNAADWDKKKLIINKTFFKAFSPRIFYYPFSFVIDVLRAQKAAIAKGYKPVENGMVLDDGAMFFGNALIEVTGANTNDPQVLSLEGKEVYTKASRRPWSEIKMDIVELTKELGKAPSQLFIWYTSCPNCTDSREVKSIIIALP